MKKYNIPNTYEIIEQRQIDDLNSMGMLLKHKKTGATISILSNDDDNKVFYIGFRTPPEDSTGVAHILEHSVLCGSKDFPVKDPFIELAKGSLNTFLNAMTYPDKTVYPVASCNQKDFDNLVHVYLDAVFYPNIYKEDKIFRQEGWHYEMESLEDDLTINGVVYNEMKGAFSTPDDVVEREMMNSLYPDTTYGMESGGDPKNIPELSYESFLDFHRKYYHPSNSLIYFYGDMDVEKQLKFLDESYLNNFDYLQIDSAISLQKPFEKMRTLEKEYPITEGESEKQNTFLTYNISMGSSLDSKWYIDMQILDYALCSAPGAPVKQALLDRGIGKDVYSIMENGIVQPYFSIVAKNSEKDKKDEFISIIESALKNIVMEGIDKKSLKAAINHYEFKYREGDFGSYPRGLMLGLQMLDSWNYDRSLPFIHVEANATYEFLKSQIQTNYFEQLIETYFLNNNHKTVLTVVPVKGLTSSEDQKLADKLDKYKETLSKEDIEKIVSDTAALTAYQESEESEEDLATIPLLKREDMTRETTGYINELRKINGQKVLFHNIFTNEIGYLKLVFDISDIEPELLPYIGVLKSMLSLVNTEQHKYSDLFNEINIVTGGLGVGINNYTNASDLSKYMMTFEVKVKTLYQNIPEALKLLSEIILDSEFTDTKRIYELLAESQSRMQAMMSQAGHSLAAIRALSYFSTTAAISESINGITEYRLLERLEGNYEKEQKDLQDKLTALCTYIFRKDNLLVDYTAEESGYKCLEESLPKLLTKLTNNGTVGQINYPEISKKNEAFITAGQVQYVCRAGNYRTKGLPYNGGLKALKVMMGYEYLWTQVRVKGGAYGCMSNFTRSGDCYFVSYRDPNLDKTVNVYKNAAEFIKNYKADERTLTQFIIGAISEMDIPMNPSAKGSFSLGGYLTGLTVEALQQERDELLNITSQGLAELWKYVDAFMEEDYLCVVGNEDKIKDNESMFMNVEQLFH